MLVGRVIVEKGRKASEQRRYFYPLSKKVNQRLHQKSGSIEVFEPDAADRDLWNELPGVMIGVGKGCSREVIRTWLGELLRDEPAADRMTHEFDKPGMMSDDRLVAPAVFVGARFEKLGQEYIVSGWALASSSDKSQPKK